MHSRGRLLDLGYLRLILRQREMFHHHFGARKMEITLFQPLFLQASDTAPISSFAASSLNSFGNARRYHPVLLTIPEPLLSIL